MTAPDHTTKPLENILRERGHPYMDTVEFKNRGVLCRITEPLIRRSSGDRLSTGPIRTHA